MNADQLQQLLLEQIPLSAAMQIHVQRADPQQVLLLAPLQPNRNLHGTAFAGSLYSLATLAGWSLLSLYAKAQGWHGDVVLRHGDIRYLRPINGDLQAQAAWADDGSLVALQQEVQRRGRGRVVIPVSLRHDNKVAVAFNGEFVFSAHT